MEITRDMIRINVFVEVEEGKREELLGLLEEVAACSREEEGCLGYEIMVSPRRVGLLMIVETWEGETVLMAHRETRHFKELVPRAKALAGRWDAMKFEGK